MKKLTLTLIAAAFAIAGSANLLRAQDQAPSTTGTNGDLQCPAGGHHHDGDGDKGEGEGKGEHKGGHKHQQPAPAPSSSQGQ